MTSPPEWTCRHCGYSCDHHRDFRHEPTTPDICERLCEEVLAENRARRAGSPPQIEDPSQNNNVHVRLWDSGPAIDLGASAPALIEAGLGALGDLAKKSPGFMLSPILAHAVNKLRGAREERPAPVKVKLYRACNVCSGSVCSCNACRNDTRGRMPGCEHPEPKE